LQFLALAAAVRLKLFSQKVESISLENAKKELAE
jgi:hypothetical protein